jgi:hypothetical protein
VRRTQRIRHYDGDNIRVLGFDAEADADASYDYVREEKLEASA